MATFDGDELTETLSSVHTDETPPTTLLMHPGGKHLLCVFSGDVAVYGVEPNGREGGRLTASTPCPPLQLLIQLLNLSERTFKGEDTTRV